MTPTTTRRRRPSKKPKSRQTWRELVRGVFHRSKGGELALTDLYEALGKTPKAKANPHWKAKIRQTVQLDSEFEPAGNRGVWRLKVKR